jgi:hypothetical protein
MNVEIGAEAAQFPEKEYISGIAAAVQILLVCRCCVLAERPECFNIIIPSNDQTYQQASNM